MEDPVSQLISRLSKPPSGTFVFLGDEPQLLNEGRDAVRKAGDFDECERADISALADASNPDSKILEARGGALFGKGGGCLYDISGIGKPPDACLKRLQHFAKKVLKDPDVLIISVYGLEGRDLSRDRSGFKAAWVRDLANLGDYAVARRLSAAEAAPWCRKWAEEFEVKLSADTVKWIAAQTEGNLSAAKQCIIKMSLDAGKDGEAEESEEARAKQALSGGARYNSFHLIEAALAGKGTESVNILNALLETGEPLPLIIWALNSAASGVLAAKRGQWPAGLSRDAAAAAKKVAKGTYENDAAEVLARVAFADRAVKGVVRIDIKTALTDAVVALALLARPDVKIPLPDLQRKIYDEL